MRQKFMTGIGLTLASVLAAATAVCAAAANQEFYGGKVIRIIVGFSVGAFYAPLTATFRQQGCVRFCYLAAGSVTPRRYRCQPDYEIEQQEKAREADGGVLSADERAFIRGWLVPSFVDRRYGQPSYAQLRLSARTSTQRSTQKVWPAAQSTEQRPA